MVQWLRICLLMQGTWVRSLVGEDPTCCGATKPMSHNYWSPQGLEPVLPNRRPPQWEARTPQLESSFLSLQLEKLLHSNKDPSQTKISYFFKCYYNNRKRDFLNLSLFSSQEENSLLLGQRMAVGLAHFSNSYTNWLSRYSKIREAIHSKVNWWLFNISS